MFLNTKIKLIIFIALLFAAFLSLSATVFSAAENTVTVTQKDSKAALVKGDVLVVKLEMTAGTGYSWQVEKNDAGKLQPVGKPQFEQFKKGVAGGNGYQVFRFKAKAAGTIELKLNYLRSWEKNKAPAKTYAITVEIKNYKVSSIPIKETTYYYTLDIKYPQITGYFSETSCGKFNNIVQGYIFDQIKDFKEQAKESKNLLDTVKQPSSITFNYETKLSTGQLISAVLTGNSYYTGSAHPMDLYYTLVYDLKNNKELTLKDLFKPDSGYLNIISKYCIDYLSKQQDANSEMISAGAAPKEENYKNFYITKEGLGIIFIPYQVGSRPFGSPNVLIPYESLKDIINMEGPAGSLVK
ncbi:MAG: protease inhibitor I42 family protein [Firmicutes bacterium]|nr:protease inhibitor I42 family protein [Bacillota bacterium]